MACDVVGPHPNRIGDPKDVTKVGAVEGGAPQNTRGAQPMYGNVQSGNNNQGGGIRTPVPPILMATTTKTRITPRILHPSSVPPPTASMSPPSPGSTCIPTVG